MKIESTGELEQSSAAAFIDRRPGTTADTETTATDPYPAFPAELKALPNFVVWNYELRNGKPTKVPTNPDNFRRADCTDTRTWSTYENALAGSTLSEGIGCVITSPYVAVDLDKCRDPKTRETEPWARQILDELNSYSEISPSGRGFHIWVRSSLPNGRRRVGRVEMYDKARYFTVTGNQVADTSPNIEVRDLTSLHSRLETLDPQNITTSPTKQVESRGSSPSSKLESLIAGRWQGLYTSQSEADSALCVMLARKHDCDVAIIAAEFRKSGLYREKWDRQDYRDRTIENAIDLVKKDTRPPSGPQDKAENADALNWRSSFKSYSEMEPGEPQFLIKNFLPYGVTFVGGLPGSGKTWLCLSMAKALTTGQKFLGHYEVPAPAPVLYLIPEVGERSFRARLDKMRLTTAGDWFICRTMKDGICSLNEGRLIAAVKALKPVVILDTAIRFSTADSENSATDNRQLTNGIFGLLKAGARGVIGNHHATKASAKQSQLSLETALRGSGDIGAICDAAWGLQCTKEEELEIRVKCVKARDFEPESAFRIMGRPYINKNGDFVMIDALHSQDQHARGDALVKAIQDNPKATYRQLTAACGIPLKQIRDRAQNAGWNKKKGCCWAQIEDELL